MRYLYFKTKTTLPTHNKQWIHPKFQQINSLLESCSRISQLVQIHAQLIRTQLISDSFLASRIISLVCSSSEPPMAYARKVFDQIIQPNVLTWNFMIRGYTNSKSSLDGLLMYRLMLLRGVYPDSYTLSVVTRACAQVMGLQTGESVHAMVIKLGFDSDMFVMSGFVHLYGICAKKIEAARDMFDKMPDRDVVTWTSILSSYSQLNKWDAVLQLFDEMIGDGLEPNKVTFINLLSACGQCQNSELAKWVHCQISKYGFESDIDVSNSLISMYARCQSMPKALEVFIKMPLKNTISWNSLIVGYVQNNLYREALKTLREMLSSYSNATPDKITISCALSACTQLHDIHEGRLLHSYVTDNNMCDTFISNSLISMYAKCGDISMAEQIFFEISKRDVVSWTARISGYVNGARFNEALGIFDEMRHADMAPNAVTLVSLLSACSQIGSLEKGQEIHAYINESNVIMDACLQSALVDMYAKCGCIDTALNVFDEMNDQNTHAFNAMIGGLANHGRAEEAMKLFNKMEKLDQFKPDNVTFKAVLSACAHSGMISEAFRIFHFMSKLYDVSVDLDHYGCMVDLLGRAGLIEQAIDLVKNMPFEPNHVIWGSLLAACRVYCRPDLGEEIAKNITMPDDAAHVLVSNLYAESGRWDDVRREREVMGRNRIERSPGYSLI